MASPRLQTPRAIGGCSLRQLIIFYLSPIHRAIYDTPSTVGGMHGAPSTLHANDDTRTRFGAEKSMTGITASLHEVGPQELSRQQLQLVARPGDSRGTTSTTPLPGTNIIIVDRRTRAEYRRSLHVSGPFNGPPNFKVSNIDKYELKQDPEGWLAVYTTAARAAGASEDVMTVYLPIVLGQDALQWLRHLPRHCIDDWSDFSRRFIANFQSLSDKPVQPWDLKSIKRRGYETLWSYLKRFQTMRNRIPEVAEAAVIEDFYRGSNDSAFVRAILQKAPTTSEQLFREADLYITADKRAQDLIGGAKPAPTAPWRDTNQQPNKRWKKRPREEVQPLDHPPLAPEEHLEEANVHWTTSSMPSAHTTRTCATPSGTAQTSSTPLGTADPSNLYHLPHLEEDPENLDCLNNRKGEEAEHSRALTEKSTSSSVDMGRKKARGNRSSTTVRC
jgi:hypothetical protein